MKQIIANVSGLTIEEKQRVNEALAKITGVRVCNPPRWGAVATMYSPSFDGANVGWDYNRIHTPQQVLEMAGMAKQGHIHAHLMALYAEDAKTTDKPWELWQVKTGPFGWVDCRYSPSWESSCEFRRKPKTHIVNGVEVPDLRVAPKNGEWYYLVDPVAPEFTYSCKADEAISDSSRASRRLCYEPTEAGKQAAILHAKIMLGIA